MFAARSSYPKSKVLEVSGVYILFDFSFFLVEILIFFHFCRYEMLGEFFNSLDISIRRLRKKGLKSIFANIGPAIEYLTDRYIFISKRLNLFY